MGFFNSLSTRIPLALLGGFLYGSLAYVMALLPGLSSELAKFAGTVVFLFYLASRFLLLFSGARTLYYSKAKKTGSTEPYENTSFYKTAQWVGKLYHYHDVVLFVFLVLLSLAFLTSIIFDGKGHKPFGQTIQFLLNFLTPS